LNGRSQADQPLLIADPAELIDPRIETFAEAADLSGDTAAQRLRSIQPVYLDC
jgi:hypothetical protein